MAEEQVKVKVYVVHTTGFRPDILVVYKSREAAEARCCEIMDTEEDAIWVQYKNGWRYVKGFAPVMIVYLTERIIN